jgi:Flp pilus assembly protein TadG
MLYPVPKKRCSARRGAAAVELALVAPLLVFLFLLAIDYGRLFYYSQIVTNCSRNGALYASDPVAASQSPYANLQQAATADASPDMAGSMTVTSTSWSDSSGNYTEVTVSYPFSTITNYPGIPSQITLTRRARVRVTPLVPN